MLAQCTSSTYIRAEDTPGGKTLGRRRGWRMLSGARLLASLHARRKRPLISSVSCHFYVSQNQQSFSTRNYNVKLALVILPRDSR